MAVPHQPEAEPQSLVGPVSARSAMLNVLIVSDPPSLTSRQLCAASAQVGYAEATARVAATRMVQAGDLVREGRTYTLSPRLHARRRRTLAALTPTLREWTGDWELVVITAVGRSPADRATLRADLQRGGLAELREGVWMRPDNLVDADLLRDRPAQLDEVGRRMVTRPVEDPAELAARLWDLPGWAERGRTLLATAEASSEPRERFSAMVGVVRHLVADPLLPAELLPADWPGDLLRAAFDDYRRWLESERPAG